MFSSSDFIILYHQLKRIGSRVAFYQTTFSTFKRPNVPPISSITSPTDKSAIKKDWLLLQSQYYFKNAWDKIRYVERSNKSVVQQKFKKIGVPVEYNISETNYYNYGFNTISELLIVPEELEFLPENYQDNQYIIGPQTSIHRIDDTTTTETFEEIKQIVNNNDTKLIYCAFGTMVDLHTTKIMIFLQKLVQAIRSIDNITLICSVGNKLFSAFKQDQNVYFFETAPQLFVLSHVDLFITHGGLGSIKEAIETQVPMLVYPVDLTIDQPGNSARVVYHEIGLRGDIKRDTPTQILEKVTELLSNPKYKTNITAMKNRIDQNPAYKPERILEIIENLPYLA